MGSLWIKFKGCLKLNIKQICGLIFAAAGIALILMAIDAKNQIERAKTVGDKINEFFTHNPDAWNPIIKFFGGAALQTELSKYDTLTVICLVSGIVLLVGGLAIVVFCRKKSQ
jgi:hypothetical protein